MDLDGRIALFGGNDLLCPLEAEPVFEVASPNEPKIDEPRAELLSVDTVPLGGSHAIFDPSPIAGSQLLDLRGPQRDEVRHQLVDKALARILLHLVHLLNSNRHVSSWLVRLYGRKLNPKMRN